MDCYEEAVYEQINFNKIPERFREKLEPIYLENVRHLFLYLMIKLKFNL